MPPNWDVGEVSVSSKEVLWRISNFSALRLTDNTQIVSPTFAFRNKEWKLYVYPKGHEKFSSLGWFGIRACDLTFSGELVLELGIRNELQENIVSSSVDYNYNYRTYTCTRLIRVRELHARKNDIMPNGNLHIFLRIVSESEDTTCHAVLNETEDEISSLKEDLKNILLNENITDIVLKVADQEFRAHRCILAARSPVFLAMMSHDTKEKATGIVDIEDVDPSIVPDFLQYLYTENVENITPQKALLLYSVADKYQVNELKRYCLSQLLKNISTDNFCDVLTLSLQHNESSLKDECIQFFQNKSLEIVKTINWQSFLCENPMIGNELFIKHLELNQFESSKK